MKLNLLTCLTALALAFLSLTLNAQQEIDTQWKTQINSIFSGLNKAQVPHAMLLDYAMEFTDVTAYNVTVTDTTYVNANIVGYIYKTI